MTAVLVKLGLDVLQLGVQKAWSDAARQASADARRVKAHGIARQIDRHKAILERHENAYEYHEQAGNVAQTKSYAAKIKAKTQQIYALRQRWNKLAAKGF